MMVTGKTRKTVSGKVFISEKGPGAVACPLYPYVSTMSCTFLVI